MNDSSDFGINDSGILNSTVRNNNEGSKKKRNRSGNLSANSIQAEKNMANAKGSSEGNKEMMDDGPKIVILKLYFGANHQ